MASLQYDGLNPSDRVSFESKVVALLRAHHNRGVVDSEGRWYPGELARQRAVTAEVASGRLYDVLSSRQF